MPEDYTSRTHYRKERSIANERYIPPKLINRVTRYPLPHSHFTAQLEVKFAIAFQKLIVTSGTADV